MLLKAVKKFKLDNGEGQEVLDEGDLFRTESSAIVSKGYARELSPMEIREVLSDYMSYADLVFNDQADWEQG